MWGWAAGCAFGCCVRRGLGEFARGSLGRGGRGSEAGFCGRLDVHGLRDAQSSVASPVATCWASLRDWRLVWGRCACGVSGTDGCAFGYVRRGLGEFARGTVGRGGKGRTGRVFGCGLTVSAAFAAAHACETSPLCGGFEAEERGCDGTT